jgi:hypothetical protein
MAVLKQHSHGDPADRDTVAPIIGHLKFVQDYDAERRTTMGREHDHVAACLGSF